MDSDVLQKRFAYAVMTILVLSTLTIAPSAQSEDPTIDLKLIHIKLNEEEGENPPPKVDEDREYWLRYKIIITPVAENKANTARALLQSLIK